jgi:hypothetical protein
MDLEATTMNVAIPQSSAVDSSLTLDGLLNTQISAKLLNLLVGRVGLEPTTKGL